MTMTILFIPSVEIYTTPTCPDCHALKAWLAKVGVPFIEHDLTRPEVAEEAKRRTGVRIAPVTLIGSDVFYGAFLDQRSRIAAKLGLTQAA
jgi:glutaredoxin